MSSSRPGASPTNIRSAVRIPDAEDDLPAAERVQLAAGAVAEVGADGRQRFGRAAWRLGRNGPRRRRTRRRPLRRRARQRGSRLTPSTPSSVRNARCSASCSRVVHVTSRPWPAPPARARPHAPASASTRSRIARATSAFDRSVTSCSSSAVTSVTAFCVDVEAAVGAATRRWRRSGPPACGAASRAPAPRRRSVSAANPTRSACPSSPAARRAPELGQDVGRPRQAQHQFVAVLRDLLAARAPGA